MQNLLSSPDHPFVKRWVRLRLDRKSRVQEGACLLTSPREILEVGQHGALLVLISTPDTPLDEFAPFEARKHVLVTPQLMAKITGLAAPVGVAAEVALPKPGTDLGRWPLILDGVSDPGNVGSLLRTALALGWSSAVLLPGTADPFNEKTLRAAKGAAFRLPLLQRTPEQLVEEMANKGLPLCIADMEGEAPKSQRPNGCGLLLGHETRGVQHWKAGMRVHVPQSGEIESLNVAVAGGILMASLRGVV